MPYYKEHIDKVISINKEIEQSRISSLYFSLPSNSPDFTGFEQGRVNWDFDTPFEYWKPLIEYSLDNNFSFIYLLNSPKIYTQFDNLNEHLEKLDKLINNLRKLNCNKARVCNPQLMEYLNKNYPDIELYLSTSAELQSIKQYSNLFAIFKNIKECVPSWDVNKNFKLLKNLRKKFPNIKVELMVNEGCIPACPIRTSHNIYITGLAEEKFNSIFSSRFYSKKCTAIKDKNFHFYLCNANVIYPWEIGEYSKIGINNFKLVGRNHDEFRTGEYFNYYRYYLKGIDSIENIIDTPVRYFNNYISTGKNIKYTVRDIKKYLPDIKHFVKYGDLCTSRCGAECRYCYKCAEKIEKVFNASQETERKKAVNICVKNNERRIAV